MSHRAKRRRKEGRQPQVASWARRFTRPKVTLAELRGRDPQAWQAMQEIIKRFIAQNPEWVREMGRGGVAGERLHEGVEGLMDLGILKLVMHPMGLRMYVWDPGQMRYEPAGN